MPTKKPPFQRLYENTIKLENGCIEWKGLCGSSGYGHIKAFGKFVGCHRLSYELHNGPIPHGFEILHTCHNKLCINPNHLRVGTHKENMLDMKNSGRARSGIRHSQSKPVMVLGVFYGSINEAERLLNLSSGTVSYWIKNKPENAKFINREQYNGKS